MCEVGGQVGWAEEDMAIYTDVWQGESGGRKGSAILVLNKCDLTPHAPSVPADVEKTFIAQVSVSATTKEGLPLLLAAISTAAGVPSIPPGPTLSCNGCMTFVVLHDFFVGTSSMRLCFQICSVMCRRFPLVEF